ncbi:hypothetical protein BaRGS_00005718, partial [Batillaria attramentaria]
MASLPITLKETALLMFLDIPYRVWLPWQTLIERLCSLLQQFCWIMVMLEVLSCAGFASWGFNTSCVNEGI